MALRVRIKGDWFSAGKIGRQVGPNVSCHDLSWTPVLWDDEVDPDWHKTAGLEVEATKEIPTKVWIDAMAHGEDF
ncbi:hypothetical protein LCGC14_1347130 [marine sediment metagenome]|uniref:Uncharacterized protein n=1 Tax=marine sediment metagenome TaxID=412755 RepID=A0A0F9KY28_9ZZZZ